MVQVNRYEVEVAQDSPRILSPIKLYGAVRLQRRAEELTYTDTPIHRPGEHTDTDALYKYTEWSGGVAGYRHISKTAQEKRGDFMHLLLIRPVKSLRI